jgi:hypothetical protein
MFFYYAMGYLIGKHFRAILILGTLGVLWQGYKQPSEPVPTPAQPVQVSQ